MAQPLSVSFTGERELNRRLANLGGRDARKYIKAAAKEAGKVSREDARRRTPKDSGAMSKSYRQKQKIHKHKAYTGKVREAVNKLTGHTYQFNVKKIIGEDIGSQVYIDQDSLKRHASKGKSSVKIKFAKKRRGKMRAVLADFYPSFVELGNRRQNGQRPLTKALYQNNYRIYSVFLQHLKAMVAKAGR